MSTRCLPSTLNSKAFRGGSVCGGDKTKKRKIMSLTDPEQETVRLPIIK